MTTHQAIRKISPWEDILVPYAGEVVIEPGTNRIKIGDGKTNFADLPYVDGNPPEEQLSIGAKAFIEDHIHLLDNNDYETFYSLIKTTALAREVSKALFKAGLNPKEHLKECPRGCESIFYYEGSYDSDEDFKQTIKQRGWANIRNPHPNRGKTQYQWLTTSRNSDVYWNEYISRYDVDNKVENIKKKIDYLQTWKLEDNE